MVLDETELKTSKEKKKPNCSELLFLFFVVFFLALHLSTFSSPLFFLPSHLLFFLFVLLHFLLSLPVRNSNFINFYFFFLLQQKTPLLSFLLNLFYFPFCPFLFRLIIFAHHFIAFAALLPLLITLLPPFFLTAENHCVFFATFINELRLFLHEKCWWL